MRKTLLLLIAVGLFFGFSARAEVSQSDATATSTATATATATSTSTSTTSVLGEKLKGKILLAVEQNGEAYYVTDNGARIYLKDGNTAYQIMRELSLGISEADFNKLNSNDVKLRERLKGKILLRAENRGEAYYVRPQDGEPLYLKNGSEAFKIMREESLGITNANIEQIPEKTITEYKAEILALKEKVKSLQDEAAALRDELAKVKKEAAGKVAEVKKEAAAVKAEKVEKTKIEKTETVASSTGSISLSASAEGSAVKLSWATSADLNSPLGFKVVISEQENPVYPGNSYHYFSDAGVRSDTWKSLKAGTYYFRVCQYLGGKCGIYSNNEKVTIAAAEENTTASSTGSLNLESAVVDGKVKLNWTKSSGLSSPLGFKVVVSEQENPVYPGNDYHYLSNASTSSDTWEGLAPGTYYFRVCQYLGGKCGIYSNNEIVVISE
ncbi:MAG: hypothetical protein WC545_04425 [Patescibacteria group bacterium]